MCGLEQGGIADTIQYILKLFDEESQSQLVNNIFVTGGPALLPGLQERLEKELLAMRPFKSSFKINMAKVGLIN